jgi:4-aminobutyrate aminotransferase / (S)-3-amino-2-methylpropionate transaminase / 5-aminovalerate transaminase
VIGTAEVMDAPAAGGLGGTYAGNPLACAAGLAVLDVFEQEHILPRSEQLGAQFRARFLALQQEIPAIGDVRGLGMMIALEFVQDAQTKEPAPALVDRIIVEAREQGILLLKAGLYGNVLRILVPLVIDDPLVEQSLDTLSEVIRSVAG